MRKAGKQESEIAVCFPCLPAFLIHYLGPLNLGWRGTFEFPIGGRIVGHRRLLASTTAGLIVYSAEQPNDSATQSDAAEAAGNIGIALFPSFRGNCRIFTRRRPSARSRS